MAEVVIAAHVSSVEGSRASTSELVRVSVAYLASGIYGNLSFDVSVAQARDFYVGQQIEIVVRRGTSE